MVTTFVVAGIVVFVGAHNLVYSSNVSLILLVGRVISFTSLFAHVDFIASEKELLRLADEYNLDILDSKPGGCISGKRFCFSLFFQ